MKKIFIFSILIIFLSFFLILFNNNNYVSASSLYEAKVLDTDDICKFFYYKRSDRYQGLERCSLMVGYDEIKDYSCEERFFINGKNYLAIKCTEYTYYFEHKVFYFDTYQSPIIKHYYGTEIFCSVSTTKNTTNELSYALSKIASVGFPAASCDLESSTEFTFSKIDSDGSFMDYTIGKYAPTYNAYFIVKSEITIYKTVKINRYKTTSGEYIFMYDRAPNESYLENIYGMNLIRYEVE